MSSGEKLQSPQGRYVPWTTWDEWLTTYRYLYSMEDREVTHALHTVDIWRIRGRVPMAVDSTATFRRVWRLDDSKTLDAHTLRLQYSLAIVRFVNGVTDAAQKGRVAASVASLAHQAGVPRLLVDIRHESTHNELPTLPVLRLGTGQALGWLQRQYWEVQRVGVGRGRERVAATVQAYVQSQLLASLKEEERVKASGRNVQHEVDDVDEDGVGGCGIGNHGFKKRKKAGKATTFAEGVGPAGEDGDGATAYCPRREKKNRQALLTELRGMVPVGDEVVLARGLVCSLGCATGDRVLDDKTCRRVLQQLGDVWPDLAATVLVQWLDSACLRCVDEVRSESQDSALAAGPSGYGIGWYRAATSLLPEASIDSIIGDCIRRHCLAFYTVHQTAFIEIHADAAMESALGRLRHALAELGDRDSLLRDFVSVFLPTKVPVDASWIQRMRKFVDDWTDTQNTAQKNSGGWSLVPEDSWKPCAIGMMPCIHLENGSLPDLGCCALGRGTEDAWAADAVIVDSTGLLRALDHHLVDSNASAALIPNQTPEEEKQDAPSDAPCFGEGGNETDDPNETDDTCKTFKSDEMDAPSGHDGGQIDAPEAIGRLLPPKNF